MNSERNRLAIYAFAFLSVVFLEPKTVTSNAALHSMNDSSLCRVMHNYTEACNDFNKLS